jgi:hypothetical protein
MPDLGERQARLSRLRASRDESREQHRRALLELQTVDDAITVARRTARHDRETALDLARLEQRRRGLDAGLARHARELSERARAAREAGLELLATSPARLVEGLDDRVPILLLPLRIETRFRGSELLVRVYPDDIAIAHHERTLTEREVEDGQAYWRERFRANAEPDPPAGTELRRGAWNLLANRHGAYRASWIARATQPTNWSDQLTLPATVQFPDLVTKPAAWSEMPRTFIMPERFALRLSAGGHSREVLGALVPDDLPVGPDPLQANGSFGRDESTGRLRISEELRWLVDFEAAVEVGMAMRVPLELPREANGFDRIVVAGLRFATDPPANAKLMVRLIEAHRFSRGIAFLRQGTPTNNTEGARSGLASTEDAIDESFRVENDPTSLVSEADHFRKSDGQRLCEALSIALDAVRPLPAASSADIAEALAMNRALWSGTLGDYLNDLLVPLVGKADILMLRRFFVAYVAGRSLLPALRIGSQPYGILVTSALSRWTEPGDGENAAFWRELLAQLRRLESAWRGQIGQVSFIGKAGDPFTHLLAVLGLQASSVEFYSRKATSGDYISNYLLFRGAERGLGANLQQNAEREAGENFAAIGLDPTVPCRLRQLLFWREHDRLTAPVVDDEPRTPLSETIGLSRFDGMRNYIDWLRTSPREDIESGRFLDQGGVPIAAPRALLYRLLRHSFLSELERGGRDLVMGRGGSVFAELAAERVIANIGATRDFTGADVLNVDAGRLGIGGARGSVGDFLVTAARADLPLATAPTEAVGLADLDRALATIAGLPTARLERLFAEHVDLCSYRLDAWIGGLFARRLIGDQQTAQQATGLHLGSYGWIEDVRPAAGARRPVAPEQIPAALRDAAQSPVFEDDANGGYVQAPSLAHAVTAAVLRNAYLSHAEPSRAGTMAVNLSSRRVRVAQSTLEGVRGGQELAALLGYQFERGLHERHPGVELDAFIYLFRERFPFTANKLTPVPDGSPAEAVEARNVVNGYDLLEQVRGQAYPYGISGLPGEAEGSTPAARAQAAAIRAEIDALADVVDAIADVLLAESVHQAVQSNFDRTKGALQAIAEGEAPPAELHVIETPRSGRSLTFRVALPLDPAASARWHATPTPRAAANAALNAWLTEMLPAPQDIVWRVTQGISAPVFVSLSSLGLEPIDCVLMAGRRLGEFSSELERFLVHDYRTAHDVADDLTTFFFEKTDPAVPDEKALVIDPAAGQPGKHSLASVFPLLKALATLISQGRALHAQDFELAGEAQAREPANPKGWDDGSPALAGLIELKQRVESAYVALEAAGESLGDFLSNTIVPLYDALRADPQHAIGPQWGTAMPELRRRMTAIARFGLAPALPTAGLATTKINIDAMVAQAKTIMQGIQRRLAAAHTALDVTFPDPLPLDPAEKARAVALRTETRRKSYAEAAKSLLGEGFVILPLFALHPVARPELASAIAAPIVAEPLVAEEWLQSLVRMRQPMAALGTVTAYLDWTGRGALRPMPIQLPVRDGDAWIGSEYGNALGPGEVVSIVLIAAMPGVNAPLTGLLLDEWTEVVPAAEETTGLAFHYNRANAVAPQALLLAVAPVQRGGWRWEDLMAILEETLERAKLRAVEPDHLAGTPYFQALPAIVTEFSAAGYKSTLYTATTAVAAPS